MLGKRLTQTGHLGGLPNAITGKGYGVHASFLVILVQPGLGDGGVGKVGFVEHFQARTLALPSQFGDHRIAAGFWYTRIQHFDDDIDGGYRLGDLSARRIHVTGKPLYGHVKRGRKRVVYFSEIMT